MFHEMFACESVISCPYIPKFRSRRIFEPFHTPGGTDLLSGRVWSDYMDCFKGYTRQIRKQQNLTNIILMHYKCKTKN